MKKVLAIDFGASSGRAILGSFDGEKITLEEIHRFSNDPVFVGDTMYWDVLRLLFEIKQSIIKSKAYGEIESIAIDTWGVDFGLLDKDGRLLENPVHYRDSRTKGFYKKLKSVISDNEFYSKTGIQFMEINTVYQLMSLKENRPDLLSRADKMLLMPDLFCYFLTGKKVAEMSIASTTQLFDAKNKCWSDDIINALGLDRSLFPEIVDSGTVVGELSCEICRELDIKPCKVISVCGHDTQSAQVSVNANENDFAFLSCGTWSLLGTELSEPVLTEESLKLNVTNETGYMRKTSFLKNIIGLWLLQESKRQFAREGKNYSYADMERMARNEKPLMCFIDPDSEEFVPAGNIPQRVKQYCKRTNQYVPKTDGEVIRCIYDSLALKYKSAISQLEECTDKRFSKLYMVGGGTKDKLLSELSANACGIEVSCGPVEATAFGNIALQLIANGKIKDLSHAREVISASERLALFMPENTDMWNEAYKKYCEVTKNA